MIMKLGYSQEMSLRFVLTLAVIQRYAWVEFFKEA